ncbi:MAG: UDP-N-acetylmuramate dehydrogenase [Holosporaceae bacterium]|jgi:UDP-N-acetylmuramate dehydrogenase|nr:UDP-N-acetylmuramate dehydrogenase [Holosporaceae bacterium]
MSDTGNFLPLRGILRENENLGEKSFFGVGGAAELLFIPSNMDDLVLFLRERPNDAQITILGAMSNVLIRAGGIKGVVIILGEWFGRIFLEGNVMEVGAAVGCSKLSSFAMNNELGGFEFLMGIPGTIGGAIKMNAGCYDSSISDRLIECEGVDFDGRIRWFRLQDMRFGYRASSIPDNVILTRAWFRGDPSVNYSISRRVNEIVAMRKNDQPQNRRSCGSVFKNVESRRAWELIDAAGCRGLRVGGAVISEKHCNFIINEENASSDDIEDLGELVIQKVLKNSGIRLEWEIMRLGTRDIKR